MFHPQDSANIVDILRLALCESRKVAVQWTPGMRSASCCGMKSVHIIAHAGVATEAKLDKWKNTAGGPGMTPSSRPPAADMLEGMYS